MFRDPEIRAVFYDAFLICGIVLLSTLTRNWAFLGLTAYGIAVAAEQKLGKALCVYLLIAFLPAVNLMLMPRYGHYAIISRLSSLLITAALILGAGTRPGRHQIPLGTIFLYLAVAIISSMFGYFPLISYLKIINFAIFILGIYVGTKNMNLRANDIHQIRHIILAIVLLLTYGSLLTLPFPSIAYFTSLQNAVREYGIGFAEDVFSSGNQMFLFSGVGTSSQFIGPACACLSAWLLCDMWLVKKKMSTLHLALMAPIPLICFLSRSRLAFFVLLIALFLTTIFGLPQARVSRRVKSAFWALICVGALFLLIMATISEIRDHSISRWIRKTDNVSEDERTIVNAITNSRQSLIEENMRDFRRNRLLGSGFQVAANTRARYQAGRASLFSASIEKGLLPLMILGETGILGACAFSFFLFVFYQTCSRKRYTATATLFTVYLSTNMAEATFFSPSGGGGTLWILMVVGGFVIDMQQYVPQPRLLPIIDDESFSEEDAQSETSDMTNPNLPEEIIDAPESMPDLEFSDPC